MRLHRMLPNTKRCKQARSQDLEKGGGGDFFERVRKVQTTLTRIFIALESESHSLSESSRKFLGKLGNSNVFLDQKQVVSEKKKKFFTEIETDFPANIINSNAFSDRITTCSSQLRLPISFDGAVFNFLPKIALKSTKNVRFCILPKPMGGLEPPPPPLATLLDAKRHEPTKFCRHRQLAKGCNRSQFTRVVA